MNLYIVFDNLADARRMQRLVLAVHHLPAAHVEYGGGTHTGSGVTPPPDPAPPIWDGYTTRAEPWICMPTGPDLGPYAEPESGPVALRWSDELAAVVSERLAELATSDVEWLVARASEAVELGSSWYETIETMYETVHRLRECDVMPEPSSSTESSSTESSSAEASSTESSSTGSSSSGTEGS